jgi:hypothetical protein
MSNFTARRIARGVTMSPRLTLSVWNSVQSYLLVCLVLTSLFFVAAATLAGQISAIFGIIGLWILVLDLRPTFELLLRVGRTLQVSALSRQETAADRAPVLVRVAGAVLVLWAIAAGIPQQVDEARVPATSTISR